MASARASARSDSQYRPPSENESGVIFSMPMTRVRCGSAPRRLPHHQSRRGACPQTECFFQGLCNGQQLRSASRQPRSAGLACFAGRRTRTSAASPEAPGRLTHQPPGTCCSQSNSAGGNFSRDADQLGGESGERSGQGRRFSPGCPIRDHSSAIGTSVLWGSRRASTAILSRELRCSQCF